MCARKKPRSYFWKYEHDQCPGCDGIKARPAELCTRCRSKNRPVKRLVVAQPDDPTIRYIPLTRGKVAIVDSEDYERVLAMSPVWQANWDSKGNHFYAAARVDGKGVQMHRVVLDAPRGTEVDHKRIDDTLDNRKSNLRIATRSMQCFHQKPKSTNKTGVPGVQWRESRKCWAVDISKGGKRFYLGQFVTFEEATRVRIDAEMRLFGERKA